MPDNQPSQEELDRIIRIWNQKHPKYKGMLEAQPYELGDDSDWYWSQTERQYIYKNDNKVPWTIIGGLVVALMVGNKLSDVTYGGLSTYAQLAEGLKSGALSVADWKAGMQSLITMGQQTGVLVSNGGIEFMTNGDWTYTQSLIDKQFAFLDGFAKDITDNPEKWMNGRLDNRMRLYQESAYSTYQNGLRREATLGGMDEERRVLGVADHCPGCLEQAGLGWQPIGTLDEIGAEECNQNCRCEFEYRNSKDVTSEEDTQNTESATETRKIEEAIIKEGDTIRNDEFESFKILDSNTGEVIYEKSGNSRNVIIPDDKIKLIDGNIDMHNHPFDTSFSSGDLRTISLQNPSESVVVSKDYTYILKPTGDSWPTQGDFGHAYSEAFSKVEVPSGFSKYKSPDEGADPKLFSDFTHNIMLDISNNLPVSYERIPVQ